jgi:hypothetical protein
MPRTNLSFMALAAGVVLTVPACGGEDGAGAPAQVGAGASGSGGGSGDAGTGGSDATGGGAGSTASGGTPAIGGAAGTGGATDAGFSSGSGGSGGASGAGDASDAGGASGTGGIVGTGGAVNTGGVSGTGGTTAFPCNGPGSRYATGSPDHVFGTGQNYQQDLFPTPVLGPPKGGGSGAASLDVVALGNGGYVIVEFDGNAIIDGPGPDFIVFENVFLAGGNPDNPFVEIAAVAVSDDGQTWTEFPCTATASPWENCAGWHPTYANPDNNTIDPTDPAVAGGDAFDLGDIGVARARYVKITDRADLTGTNAVFDLDAVSIHNAACP